MCLLKMLTDIYWTSFRSMHLEGLYRKFTIFEIFAARFYQYCSYLIVRIFLMSFCFGYFGAPDQLLIISNCSIKPCFLFICLNFTSLSFTKSSKVLFFKNTDTTKYFEILILLMLGVGHLWPSSRGMVESKLTWQKFEPPSQS